MGVTLCVCVAEHVQCVDLITYTQLEIQPEKDQRSKQIQSS